MMNRFISNRKCMVFHLGWLALCAAALGGTGEREPAWSKGAQAYSRRVTATKNRLALEAYEKRNAEITLRAEDAVPTITDNAALLYYQACVFMPEPNKAVRTQIRLNPGPGKESPSKEIRTYLGHCLPVIEMVETASRIPGCDWAVWPQGRPGWDPLRLKLSLIHDVLLMDARTLAVDGHYRVALERCLTLRRIARHLSDDPELYPYGFGGAADVKALYTIRYLLGMMPPDANILTWFRDRFSSVPGPRLSFAHSFTMQTKVKIQLDALRTNPDHLRKYREMAVREAEKRQAKENIRGLTDEQFRLRAREGLAQFTDSILRIIDSEATYEQKLSQVRGLCKEMMEDDSTDPVLKSHIGPSGMNMKVAIDRSYSAQVKHEARVNETKAGLEVYLVLAKTGRLPEKLPDHLPKDPFTNRNFGYEMTREGFALYCQGAGRQRFEFKVHK